MNINEILKGQAYLQICEIFRTMDETDIPEQILAILEAVNYSGYSAELEMMLSGFIEDLISLQEQKSDE